MIQLIENAREAFEAERENIPTQLKIQYLNQLFEIGYFAVDIGKYGQEPQYRFADIEEVISSVEKRDTRIMVLVDTKEGYTKALKNPKIDFVEIPFSLLDEIKEIPTDDKEIIVNLSLDFNVDILKNNQIQSAINQCKNISIKKIKLYNTTILDETNCKTILENIKGEFPEMEFIAHFYVQEKSYKPIFTMLHSCDYPFLESSIKGWGRNKTGNTIPTEKALTFQVAIKEKTKINILALETAYNTAKKIFSES